MQHLEALKKSGQAILDLTESNPTHCGFQCFDKRILNALPSAKNLNYEPQCKGMLKARRAISRYYQKKGLHVDPERIFLTSSTSEAYSFLFRLLLNPEEGLLIPKPSYPLFEFLAQLNDAQIDFYQLAYGKKMPGGENSWRLDFDELNSAVKKETRAMVVVNPNNPTGSFLKQDERRGLNEFCQKHHMSIICDEVFSDYRLSTNEDNVASLAENNDVLTFSLSGISKILGLPQMKLGWIVLSGPEKDCQEAACRLEVILDTYLSVNTPVQNALEEWLSLQAEIKNEILGRLKENYEFTKKSLFTMAACECLALEGGWYVILRLPQNNKEEEWVLKFLKEDHVFVHPGYFFDFDKGAHIVLSLLTPVEIFQKGLARILKRIKTELSC